MVKSEPSGTTHDFGYILTFNLRITVRARHLMSRLHPDRFSSRTSQEKVIDEQEFARVSLAKTELLDAELVSMMVCIQDSN